MKFMIDFIYPASNFLSVMKAWGALSPQDRASVGEGVKLLSRWHDLAGRRAWVTVESNDLAAVICWVGGWSPLTDVVITPVFDDEESGAVARKIAANHNA